MAENGIDYRQFDKFLDGMEKMDKDFPMFCETFMKKTGQKVISKAKKRTPVDTGALRNSWKAEDPRRMGKDYAIDIVNGQHYATFIEYGTCRGIRPYYMVTVPIDQVVASMPKDFFNEWHKYLKSKGCL